MEMSWELSQQIVHSAGSRPSDGGGGEGRSSRPRENGGRGLENFFQADLPWIRQAFS